MAHDASRDCLSLVLVKRGTSGQKSENLVCARFKVVCFQRSHWCLSGISSTPLWVRNDKRRALGTPEAMPSTTQFEECGDEEDYCDDG